MIVSSTMLLCFKEFCFDALRLNGVVVDSLGLQRPLQLLFSPMRSGLCLGVVGFDP